MKKKPRNHKKAFRRAIWAALGKLIGVGLGAGAGSILHDLVGGGLEGWAVAGSMALASFALTLFVEYERELD